MFWERGRGRGRGHFIHLAIYCTATWCFVLKGLRTTMHQSESSVFSILLEYARLYEEHDLAKKCLKYIQKYTAQVLIQRCARQSGWIQGGSRADPGWIQGGSRADPGKIQGRSRADPTQCISQGRSRADPGWIQGGPGRIQGGPGQIQGRSRADPMQCISQGRSRADPGRIQGGSRAGPVLCNRTNINRTLDCWFDHT